MKTNKSRKNETKVEGRDPFEVFLMWSTIGGGCLFMLSIFVLSPLAYLWILGLVGIAGTMVATALSCHAMISTGPLGFFFAGDIIKVGFQVIGAILCGLAEASK